MSEKLSEAEWHEHYNEGIQSLKEEIDRLRAENAELREWRDHAVASCAKRRCSERDAELTAEKERSKAWRQIAEDLCDGAECLPECDSHAHSPDCPLMNAANHIRILHWRLRRVEKYLRLYHSACVTEADRQEISDFLCDGWLAW